MESRFQGMKQALQSMSPEDTERIRRMMADLNDLLLAHLRGDDTTKQFARLHAPARRVLPGEPAQHRGAGRRARGPRGRRAADDELDVRAAARRAVGADVAARSAILGCVEQVSTLDANLRALRPGEDWTGSARFRGNQPMGMGEGAQAMADLAEIDALAEQLAQSYPGARLEDIDLEALERQLDEDAGVDARRLSELEQQLREQGLLRAGAGRIASPVAQGVAQAGTDRAARTCSNAARTAGQRDSTLAGAAGEPTGATRPWQFGDTAPWDTSRTVRNAVLRQASTGPGAAGRGGRRGRGDRAAGRGRRSRCAWTRRGRWCRTGGGCR